MFRRTCGREDITAPISRKYILPMDISVTEQRYLVKLFFSVNLYM